LVLKPRKRQGKPQGGKKRPAEAVTVYEFDAQGRLVEVTFRSQADIRHPEFDAKGAPTKHPTKRGQKKKKKGR
jgi:YD repeat-containing protein